MDARGVKRKRSEIEGLHPRELDILKFAYNRAAELEAMSTSLKVVGASRNVFQNLPKHMRRRAASHNLKRLPRNIRDAAQIEMDKAPPKSSKRPSRFHRRRPKNSLKEYARRQQNNVWLETHIWHAKRFHMVNKWGYRLPDHSTDKSYRASHRASTNNALLMDMSYMSCIEICGTQESIAECVLPLIPTGLTVQSESYTGGNKEGQSVLYRPNEFPRGAIGEVTFLWKPKSCIDNNVRRLWLWVHPACYNEVWNLLTITNSPDTTEASPQTLTLTSLKDVLVRFRIVGPTSTKVLKETFQKPSDISLPVNEQWDEFDIVANVSSPASMPPGGILGLTVQDPRLSIPQKISPVAVTGNNEPSPNLAAFSASHSTLWDAGVRKHATDSHLSQHELNEKRSELLVPGSTLDDTSLGQSDIPIILIQKPGHRSDRNSHPMKGGPVVGYGSGWDIVLPAGWSTAFWVAFVYRGARAGGLRELQSISEEQGVFGFPFGFPDTKAGKAEETERRVLLEEKYERYPPAKRPNYIKLGVQTPFSYPWEVLVNDWSNSDGLGWYVVRDKAILGQLGNMCESRERGQHIETQAAQLDELMHTLGGTCGAVAIEHKRALVEVRLSMVSKGHPEEFGSISIPTVDDLEFFKANPNYGGPLEPQHEDKKFKERKNLQKSLKGRPKARRSEVLVTTRETDAKCVSCDVTTSRDVTTVPTVNGSCSRVIIGYVKHGKFSYCLGHGVGLGFCSVAGLLKCRQINARVIVLVRNTTSLQYRFAYINTIQ